MNLVGNQNIKMS